MTLVHAKKKKHSPRKKSTPAHQKKQATEKKHKKALTTIPVYSM